MEDGGGIRTSLTPCSPTPSAEPTLATEGQDNEAADGEEYGDVEVDTNKSFEYYKRWNEMAKENEVHPRGERRPTWMNRPLPPRKEHRFIRE